VNAEMKNRRHAATVSEGVLNTATAHYTETFTSPGDYVSAGFELLILIGVPHVPMRKLMQESL